eukprot:3882929-Pleurochrysis_carterae.AAC.1
MHLADWPASSSLLLESPICLLFYIVPISPPPRGGSVVLQSWPACLVWHHHGVEDGLEGCVVSPSQAASPQEEMFPGVQGLGKAVEVMQLSKDIDELNAEDGTPTRQLHEG